MSFSKARKRAGLTQAEVAAKLGISSAAVSYWETGKTLPQAQFLPKLASLYNCTVDDLLRSEEDMDEGVD